MPELALQQSRVRSSDLARSARSTQAALQSTSSRHSALDRQQTLGNQAMQRLLHSRVIQAKLAINAPGDQYEQEADSVAEQVVSATPSPILQRKCACGGAHHADGECAECQKKRLSLQRQAADHSKSVGVSPIVHEVLRSAGQPLDLATRAFMEPRFGCDFSQVRVHTDAKAAESVRAVNALAYTVGSDIVFGARQYAPNSSAGRRLLTHELTHTLQQARGRGAVTGAQRATALQVNAPDDAYEREAEAQAARVALECNTPPVPVQEHNHAAMLQRQADPSQVPPGMTCPVATTSAAGVVTNTLLFGTRVATLSVAQKAEIERFVVSWQALGGNMDVRVDGYASIDGSQDVNWQLSCDRAEAVRAELLSPLSGTVPGIPAGSIEIFANGETDVFGSTADPNRCATITTIAPLPSPPAPPPPGPVTGFVCGPDVTTQVSDAVSRTRTTFGGWTNAQREDACDALISLSTGAYAWDIGGLHNNAWILGYSPACASQGANPRCGSSVQVGPDCHYAGSANYVIFGVMFNLCNAFFTSIGATSDADDFTESEALDWVDKYKGTGFTGLSTPSANFVPSQNWTRAGFRGWPSVPAPPGDRTNCAPTCATVHSGGAFRVHWVPIGWF